MLGAAFISFCLVLLGVAGYTLFKYGAKSNENKSLNEQMKQIKEAHGEMERQDSIVAGNPYVSGMSKKLSDALREDGLS